MTVLALTDTAPVLSRMHRRRWMALSVPVILGLSIALTRKQES